MSSVVLDASALMALLRREPGAAAVAKALDAGASMSAVNLSETVAKLLDAGVGEDSIRDAIAALDVEILDFGTELAYAAGHLRAATRTAGLSLGDRACLALAQQLGLPALTAERSWPGLALEVTIQLIR